MLYGVKRTPPLGSGYNSGTPRSNVDMAWCHRPVRGYGIVVAWGFLVGVLMSLHSRVWP